MRVLWTVAVAALCTLAVEAYADTVYLKNGETVWGREVTEEGETVIVVRPSGTLRFPKRDVSRIERERTSIPKHYEPPTTGGGARDEGQTPARPATPPAAPAASAPEAPAPGQTPQTTVPAVTPPAAAGPSQLTPTALPPPPPPPTLIQPIQPR
jgi:hypothetical protein